MLLQKVPLGFALAGLVFYVVLGGADFGAGFWQLTAGRRPGADRLREQTHHAMGPVWEANHVWLIFVLTVTWTAYPQVFASIASTLCVPLFVAAIGIILRGGAYALRPGMHTPGERRAVETVFSASSILTPFALGAVIGGVAAGRVPVGNAAGNLVTSWLNPLGVMVGLLAVATCAYLAAVFLCADAVRQGDAELERRFRSRALVAAVVAGAAAAAGLVALRYDAHRVYENLLFGRGVEALVISGAAGLATLALVARRRYEPSRYTAALAVAAIIAGWALAQAPVLLPGLTIDQAAAAHDTLVTLTIAVVAGGIVLFPSLVLLFRLFLAGRLESDPAAAGGPAVPVRALGAPGAAIARGAVACLVAGVGLTTIANAGWAHAIGITCLLCFIALGARAALTPAMLE
jgi:cytochrome bd ubiquinol oxidase subunit II